MANDPNETIDQDSIIPVRTISRQELAKLDINNPELDPATKKASMALYVLERGDFTAEGRKPILSIENNVSGEDKNIGAYLSELLGDPLNLKANKRVIGTGKTFTKELNPDQTNALIQYVKDVVPEYKPAIPFSAAPDLKTEHDRSATQEKRNDAALRNAMRALQHEGLLLGKTLSTSGKAIEFVADQSTRNRVADYLRNGSEKIQSTTRASSSGDVLSVSGAELDKLLKIMPIEFEYNDLPKVVRSSSRPHKLGGAHGLDGNTHHRNEHPGVDHHDSILHPDTGLNQKESSLAECRWQQRMDERASNKSQTPIR